MIKLNALVIEDDPKILEELLETLPRRIQDCEILWTGCTSFDDAVGKVEINRYELIITDIYINSKGHKKSHDIQDTGAQRTITAIRQYRFCPILAVTDGSKPEQFPNSPFIRYADKTDLDAIEQQIEFLISTGIPQISRNIHDQIDADSSEYLWGFLEKSWEQIPHDDYSVLERLVRRRTSIVLGKLDLNTQTEIEFIEGLEFYIYPSIAGDIYRLGEVIRSKETNKFRVLLTPHCHLNIQKNDTYPRAEYVLTVKTRDALELNKEMPIEAKKALKRLEEIRRRTQGPSQFNGQARPESKAFQPSARYWFLPAFVDIPDLYCDFLQLESISFESLLSDYDRIAVLDTPFAESLQISFTSFYSAIGTANLNPERFTHLGENDQD